MSEVLVFEKRNQSERDAKLNVLNNILNFNY